MLTQTDLMLIEEFSEQELEAISGGGSLIEVSNIRIPVNVDVDIRDIKVAVQALTSGSFIEQ
jgi:hypothetical protein